MGAKEIGVFLSLKTAVVINLEHRDKRFHKEKIENAERGLQKLLKNPNSNLTKKEKDITKAIIKDINDALSGN